ncbi:Gnk2-homologous domain protein [Raphanus sativus]|nr:Gnk2-homologous domain protein [Raphanus sativus]
MFYSGSYKGFYLFGNGAESAILQCRADSYGTKCHDCFATALAVLRRKCPWYKGMIIWFDQCLLAFSSIDFLEKIDYDNNFCMSNAKKLGGDKPAFSRTLNTLMDNLTTLATTTKGKDNYTMFSAGETWYKGDRMYGMVQCTYDLSPRACRTQRNLPWNFKETVLSNREDPENDQDIKSKPSPRRVWPSGVQDRGLAARRPGPWSDLPARRNGTTVWTPGVQDVSLGARRADTGRRSGRPVRRNETSVWTPGAKDVILGSQRAETGRRSGRPAPRK